MYDLHELTKEAARVISADSFEVIPKFKILEIITEENKASECSKEDALQTRTRL